MLKDEQLTQNFNRKEFKCRCGCGLDKISLEIVNRLQVIRDIIEEPMFISSACRCPTHNKNEKGKDDSYHLEKNGCKAVDWTIKDKDKLRRFATFMEDKWSGGFHYYPEKTLPNGAIQKAFIHSDTGPRRRW